MRKMFLFLVAVLLVSFSGLSEAGMGGIRFVKFINGNMVVIENFDEDEEEALFFCLEGIKSLRQEEGKEVKIEIIKKPLSTGLEAYPEKGNLLEKFWKNFNDFFRMEMGEFIRKHMKEEGEKTTQVP